MTLLKEDRRGNQEDAVSEAIGFILIFSLVMIGIGLITLYGYPILLEQQSNANVKNMERDMIVLQNDMKSLVYKNSPYKETSLQVSGGALTVYNYSTKTASFTITTSTGIGPLNNDCGQLRYESDKGESIIALENGAVITRMEFQQGSAMLSEPRWFFDNSNNTRTLVLTFMNVSSNSILSRNGIGTVKMRLNQSVYDPIVGTSGMDVTIHYYPDQNSSFSKAWENYIMNNFETYGMTNPSPDTYNIADIHNLIIKQYDITIEGI